ncbi:hypothetical protein PCC8801_0421 [Rippkaea orientalis PCC 8801]|uniref:Uncharacterized protein n=1 Tax=Rippkaea orientalis (strain PCC 8801 / RF-1) TaxID=41431 RepID=B7JUD8_RIPO1|nr:hypothetical protein [Rippkaea orientalis]ACK64518.1 hypothetical protein PCC8801_0421 [Rippkaea orientalis PCC 8801]
MSKIEAQYLFNTLEGYEKFITDLLDNETVDVMVDPRLDWEEAIFNNNLLLK